MGDTFEEIVGHARQCEMLQRLIQTGTAAGTYLFSGPEHLGKETVAFAFARALLGEGTNIEAHPDCIVLGPQGASQTIRLSQVEDLRRRSQLTSFHGGWKVGIIRQADKLYYQAAPALLKILEEPPPRTVFILITHKGDDVLPTLRSRCKIVSFFPLSSKEMQGFLSRACGDSSDGDQEVLLRLSEGRPGMVSHIAKGKFLETRDAILGLLENLVFERFSSVLMTVEGLVDLGKVARSKSKDKREEEVEGQRQAQRDLLFGIQTLVRDLWVLQRDVEAPLLHRDLEGRLAHLSAAWGSARTEAVLGGVHVAGVDLERNVSLRLILERVLSCAGEKAIA
jgi:hypothetical protein